MSSCQVMKKSRRLFSQMRRLLKKPRKLKQRFRKKVKRKIFLTNMEKASS